MDIQTIHTRRSKLGKWETEKETDQNSYQALLSEEWTLHTVLQVFKIHVKVILNTHTLRSKLGELKAKKEIDQKLPCIAKWRKGHNSTHSTSSFQETCEGRTWRWKAGTWRGPGQPPGTVSAPVSEGAGPGRPPPPTPSPMALHPPGEACTAVWRRCGCSRSCIGL